MGTYKGYINGNIIILKHALYSQVFKKNSISVDGFYLTRTIKKYFVKKKKKKKGNNNKNLGINLS